MPPEYPSSVPTLTHIHSPFPPPSSPKQLQGSPPPGGPRSLSLSHSLLRWRLNTSPHTPMLWGSTLLLSYSSSMKAALALSAGQDVPGEATVFWDVPRVGSGKVGKVLSWVTVAALTHRQGCPQKSLCSELQNDPGQTKSRSQVSALSNSCQRLEKKTKKHPSK